MNTIHLFFLVFSLISLGLIAVVILVTRKDDWEAPAIQAKHQAMLDRLNQDMCIRMESSNYHLQTRIELQERLEQERHEKTKPINVEALEASLQDESRKVLAVSEFIRFGAGDETDTRPASPPLSNAEAQAIQFLEDLEG